MNSVAHRKNFSCIKDGADKLLDYHGVFTAFHELFLPDCTPGDSLSSEAREGLAYMFKLLAEDAINTHTPPLWSVGRADQGGRPCVMFHSPYALMRCGKPLKTCGI